MEIKFQTKEESNKEQQEAFLKLSGAERVLHFFRLSREMKNFPQKKQPPKKNNFVLKKKK